MGLTLCIAILLYRKRNIDGIWWILFLRSQIAFFIPYALQITIVILFFTIFSFLEVFSFWFIFFLWFSLIKVIIIFYNIGFGFICWAKYFKLFIFFTKRVCNFP